MMKGVNKRVVEIRNPDSLYFDKAVFYLKPNLHEVSPTLLTAEARQCLQGYSPRRLNRHPVLRAILIALLGVLLAALGYMLALL